MVACPACGKELSGDFLFCPFCGAAVTGASSASVHEQRKVVTVLFCDVTGSTALGERLDPESLRRVMARYFEVMKQSIERHGGTVEKFIGDAVMAVFGVPVSHEDDALRAVRAAWDMREALADLNDELIRDYGTRLDARIGVNTGEVVTGTEERLATGDAVNVAARLEQAAPPGEVLLGEQTLRLLLDAVDVEELPPLEVKGKREPLSTFRLVAIRPDAEATDRRLDAPMVGRARELERLRGAYSQAVGDRSCQLFTILGVAGVGKSRLAFEFLSSLDESSTVRGRCLSYGEGITYWPVVEVVKQLEPRLPDLVDDSLALSLLRSLLGDEEESSSTEEIARAVRKLLEAAAQEAPLVCVFDDIHWGEGAFLDLIEHIADLSRDAPILLLCMARPELLDRRPGWAGGKLNATTVLLEPLDAGDTDLLVDELLAGEAIDENLRAGIREAAEGNPFFCEQIVALVQASGDTDVVVPPTIQALLAARLDQLDPSEREVLERGAIEGRVFHRGAVQALAPAATQVGGGLTSLVRKELVRPTRAQVPGEDAYRFRHLLIRDATYDALPKAVRAALHERFSDWLEEHGTELVELDEILAYHLEQAHRYLAELGPLDDHARELASRASRRLVRSGRRAFDRGDMRAAAGLLTRAGALLSRGEPDSPAVRAMLASALIQIGELDRADEMLVEVIDAASAAQDAPTEARARLELIVLRLQTAPELDDRDALSEVELVVETFERLGDEEGLAMALQNVGKLHMWLGRCEEGAAVLERALGHARAAGSRIQEIYCLMWLGLALVSGPRPADEAIRRCEEICTAEPGSAAEATVRTSMGLLEAGRGQFERAQAACTAGRGLMRELGLTLDWAGSTMFVGRAHRVAGDFVKSERVLREGYDELRRIGETGYLSTVAGELGLTLALMGRLDEAQRFSEESEAAAGRWDIESQALWRDARARVLAERGDNEQAERLARESVALSRPTDFALTRVDSLDTLAHVLGVSGRSDEAVAVLEESLELLERKGYLVLVERTRSRVAGLRAAS